MTIGIILLVLIVIPILWIISVYNKLVTLQRQIKASIQEIGNQLKRQADLIPNLVETAKSYKEYEKSIFEMLSKARQAVLNAVNSADAQKMVDASTNMAKAIAPIRVVFESNPQMQSSTVFKELMDNLRDTADKVSYARRLLIDLSAEYNIVMVTFPNNLIAKMLGFKIEAGLKVAEERKHLEVGSDELKTPKIDL